MKKTLLFLSVIALLACKKDKPDDYRSAVEGLYTGRCDLYNNNTEEWSYINNAAVQVLVDINTDNTVILKGDIYDLSVPGGSHIVLINDTFAFSGGYFKGDSLIYATNDYDNDFTGFYFLKR